MTYEQAKVEASILNDRYPNWEKRAEPWQHDMSDNETGWSVAWFVRMIEANEDAARLAHCSQLHYSGAC